MALKLAAPIVKEFVLEETDKLYPSEGPPTTVTIRQATQYQDEQRSEVFSEVTRIITTRDLTGETKLRQKWTMDELRRKEVQLTLVGCNILDDDGEPLFRFKQTGKVPILDMTDFEFQKAWGSLPTTVCIEIWSKVMEVNVLWAGPLA